MLTLAAGTRACWKVAEHLQVIYVSRCTLDGKTVHRVSGLERRISSLCHECEQVGLAVSIDTHS
jgi:hypothetical protein